MPPSRGVAVSADGSDPQLDSGADMSAASLRERVLDARTSLNWTAAILQARSGLSARTLRDIEGGNADRRYSVQTLAALDRAFAWPQGTAWRAWQAQDGGGGPGETSAEELAEQMRQLRAALRQGLEEVSARIERDEVPTWAVEVIDLMRLMSAEDRRRLLDLASRLAPR